jgi:hypothetical protein
MWLGLSLDLRRMALMALMALMGSVGRAVVHQKSARCAFD